MTVETGRRAAELSSRTRRSTAERACFSFFGGEPMMAWDVLREFVLHAEQAAAAAGVTALFRMNTNGLLIKEEHLRFFEEHDLIFILSIDGDREMHDSERVTASGAARSTRSRSASRRSSRITRA